MQCPKCDAKMSHHYCETWVTGGDPYEPVEYAAMKGYWSCDSCTQTVDESDDEYYEPED
jgi:hypothetical protein